MSQKAVSHKKRIYQIDLFRFLAALSVVLYHYLFRGWQADNLSNLRFPEIGPFFKYGYLGVDMFFIISGFVIALSINSRSLKQFTISRISRLYPSYWLSVLITATIIAIFGSPIYEVGLKQVLVNLTMFQNYVKIESIDGVYWSLFVEMKFYIFIIGVYLVLNKIKNIKFDYLIYFWLLLTVANVFASNLSVFKVLRYFFILDWSSYFIAGMIFYQIFKTKLNIRYILSLGIVLSVSLYHAILRIGNLESHYNTIFSPLYISSLIVIFYLLMLLVSCGKLQSFNSPKLINLGLLTYPLYLLHQNIGFVIFNNLGTESNKYIILLLTTILMLFLAYLISVFYEPKISNYIRTKLKSFVSK